VIRTVFFDVGSTLITPDPSMAEIYRQALGPLGVDLDHRQFLEAFGLTWREMSEEIGAGRDRFGALPGGEREYWRRYVGAVLARLEARADVDRATAALHDAFARPESWRVYDDVRPAIAALAGSGLQLGIISNWDSRLPALLRSLDLEAPFGPVVYSAEAGHEKPSRVIFEQALARAGVPADEAVHIGDDRECDHEGAAAAGMTGLLLDRAGVHPPGPAVLRSLSELPARVAELRARR
jgi:putative hydrolase of the HAD superfamily